MLIATIVSVDPFGHRPRPGSGAGVLVLVAFVLSFVAIRTSAADAAALLGPGGGQSGGLHLHVSYGASA